MIPVSYKNDSGRAWVTINNPPVNATSRAVRSGLYEAVDKAVKDGCRTGVIVCAGKTFVAGGDISEFGKPALEPHLPDVYRHIERSPVIWAAALHGNVLGGGFELAMACHIRVALQGTRFGLPEVTLGLIPGAGGTQRLPRLIGAEMAAHLASSGRLIDAQSLFKAAGLDAVVSDELENNIVKLLDATRQQPLPVSERLAMPASVGFFSDFKEKIKKNSKGAVAPLLNLNAVQWATESEFEKGQIRERKMHLELRDSEQSVALRHVFFAERSVSKPKVINNAKGRDVKHICVVGGGLMGAGISAACLNAGFTVHLIEADTNSVSGAKERVLKLLQGALEREKISESVFKQQKQAFTVGDNYKAAASADIAIEAVFEDIEVKRQVFKNLAEQVSPNAILATNTSYLNPQEFTDGIKNPDRIVGLHFFSPAHIMKLLEVVRTSYTSAEVLASAFKFAKRIKKVAVLSGVCDGFIGNRMLSAYRRQADYLLADGATPLQIDSAMRAYGMPMGPYELQDLTGLQIAWANRKRQASARASKERYVTIADQLCEMERFGQRTGMGWYKYEQGSRKAQIDEKVLQIIEGYSKLNNITRRSFSDQTIQDSMIAVLANEGMRIVEEGIAENASDIDIVKIHGYGFPRWRGGPMHAAEIMGTDKVKSALDSVSRQSPDSWVIASAYR